MPAAAATSLNESLERRWKYWRDVEAGESEEYELEICRSSIEHWVNQWCCTYDPRQPQTAIPFDLFPKQAEFLTWLREREDQQEDGLVEKSRDMGATWLCCIYALHGWLFRPGFSAGFGSRKLELVDRRGDLDSIFEKIRFLLDRLPRWMWPAGFSLTEHDNLARLVNPANGASITGEGGDNIGRGGRKSLYFVDEAAFLEHPQLIDRALSQTTRCRIDVSTPNGSGNPFAEKRFSGRVPIFTLHWRNDPRKDDAWYERQKRRFDSVTVAQEIDIDYSASVEGICIPAAWIRAAVELELPPSSLPIVAGLDIAEEGKNKSVFVARRGPHVQVPISWGQCNTTETAFRAKEECVKAGVRLLNYDCIGVGAGVRGTLASAGRLPFHPNAVNVGSAPSSAYWPDGTTSKERFANLKAELWWRLRTRFERTFEHVEHGVEHPPDELISLPNHPQLIAELSQPLRRYTQANKIQIESKDDLRKRGIASPDFAEALVLTEADSDEMLADFIQLKLRPDASLPEPPPSSLRWPQHMRWFAQTKKWQPWVVTRDNVQVWLPDFASEDEAAYAVELAHDWLGLGAASLQPEPSLYDDEADAVRQRTREHLRSLGYAIEGS